MDDKMIKRELKVLKDRLDKIEKTVELKYVKLTEDAIIPKKAVSGDLGMDFWTNEKGTIIIPPCSGKMFKTGIACIIPDGWGLCVADRSNMGSKNILFSGGIIDTQYRGEIRIVLNNINSNKMVILSDQDKEYVEKCPFFNVEKKQFVENATDEEIESYISLKKDVLVIKYTKDAIAQVLLTKNHNVEISEASIDELNKSIELSERGTNGFGHSNK